MSFYFKVRHPFHYEPDIPDDYTEHGSDTGASIEEEQSMNPDMLRIFNVTKSMSLQDSLIWLVSHTDDFAPSTLILDTDNGRSLDKYDDTQINVIVQKRSLNTIRHLNTLLNRSNEILDDGGYIWCHARTSGLKYKLINESYPWGIRHIVHACSYLWHRVMAKMDSTKWFYYGVTNGKFRTYSRVEILGRFYRAGFEVVDEQFRHGEFFVLARKIKEPIWNDPPTGSPLIKLRRVGKDGKLIGVYKFRTMHSYSEYLQPYIYKYNSLQEGGKFADDYRVTSWGKWMRKFWIDEIPMFINLFKGEMKLVGVRPLSRHYFSLYTKEMQELRTKVKPGLLPPFYYDKQTPKTIEDVQASERRYIEAYLKDPIKTDLRYFFGTIVNILFLGKRSK